MKGSGGKGSGGKNFIPRGPRSKGPAAKGFGAKGPSAAKGPVAKGPVGKGMKGAGPKGLAPVGRGGRPAVGGPVGARPGAPVWKGPGLPARVGGPVAGGGRTSAGPVAKVAGAAAEAPVARRRRWYTEPVASFKGVQEEGAPVSGGADEPFRSGFVALVGRPNVGKSTLLNQMVGTKIAIMSDKPQTTRNRILGVVNRTHSQIIFLDTPGIHKPLHRLGEMLNRTAQATLPEVDVVLFLVDGSDRPGEGDRFVANLVQKADVPVILVVNKMDRVPREKWYEAMDAYKALGENWLNVVPVSALDGRNVPDLAALIEEQLVEGPQFYPPDVVTDRPERFVIAELVREQILHRTFEEIPHAVAVEIEELVERGNGTVFCRATILVERESQRGIIIGEQGRMLKEIGTAARQEAEAILGSKLFLELWVKAKEDWRNRPSTLHQLGLQEE